MHTLATHWWVPLVITIVLWGYVRWKWSGGNLLFKFKKTDDGATTFWKAILYLGWTFGSVWVALLGGFASFIVFIVALIAFASGS